jgi:hypothetical protein
LKSGKKREEKSMPGKKHLRGVGPKEQRMYGSSRIYPVAIMAVRIAGQEITGIDLRPLNEIRKQLATCFSRRPCMIRRPPVEPARRSLRIRAQRQSSRTALPRRYERGGFRKDAFRDFGRNAEARGARAPLSNWTRLSPPNSERSAHLPMLRPPARVDRTAARLVWPTAM